MNLAIPGGMGSPPLNHYVRFTQKEHDQKMLAMQKHKSQWMKFNGYDWWEAVEARDVALGMRLPDTNLAEGFEIVFSYE
jgi:hypothetical protein